MIGSIQQADSVYGPRGAAGPPRDPFLEAALGRIAVGPKGSRDLGQQEAQEALARCLDRRGNDVQIGAFLLAERLKRESEAENHGFFAALIDASTIVTAPVDHVISLADPYDGFLRTPHFAPVVAAVLAACDVPAYVHGAWTLPPKGGITARQVLEARGVELDIGGGPEGVERAATRLAERGVAYVGLEDFCPSLSALVDIRASIAKRPFLATLEKLVTPLRGRQGTHVVSGWVHRGYEELIARLCLRRGFTSLLLVKGREGHVDPHVHDDGEVFGYLPGAEVASQAYLRPKGLGCQIAERPSSDELTAERVSDLWDEAFDRKRRTAPGQMVRLLAGAALHQSGHASTVMRGIGVAHQAMVSGRARELLGAFGP